MTGFHSCFLRGVVILLLLLLTGIATLRVIYEAKDRQHQADMPVLLYNAHRIQKDLDKAMARYNRFFRKHNGRDSWGTEMGYGGTCELPTAADIDHFFDFQLTFFWGVIQSALNHGANDIVVNFDPVKGNPTYIFIDYGEGDGSCFSVDICVVIGNEECPKSGLPSFTKM